MGQVSITSHFGSASFQYFLGQHNFPDPFNLQIIIVYKINDFNKMSWFRSKIYLLCRISRICNNAAIHDMYNYTSY